MTPVPCAHLPYLGRVFVLSGYQVQVGGRLFLELERLVCEACYRAARSQIAEPGTVPDKRSFGCECIGSAQVPSATDRRFCGTCQREIRR